MADAEAEAALLADGAESACYEQAARHAARRLPLRLGLVGLCRFALSSTSVARRAAARGSSGTIWYVTISIDAA